jgi:hypothetical protein
MSAAANIASESKTLTVKNALLESCRFGFNGKGLPEQQTRAINFVRTLNNSTAVLLGHNSNFRLLTSIYFHQIRLAPFTP